MRTLKPRVTMLAAAAATPAEVATPKEDLPEVDASEPARPVDVVVLDVAAEPALPVMLEKVVVLERDVVAARLLHLVGDGEDQVRRAEHTVDPAGALGTFRDMAFPWDLTRAELVPMPPSVGRFAWLEPLVTADEPADDLDGAILAQIAGKEPPPEAGAPPEPPAAPPEPPPEAAAPPEPHREHLRVLVLDALQKMEEPGASPEPPPEAAAPPEPPPEAAAPPEPPPEAAAPPADARSICLGIAREAATQARRDVQADAFAVLLLIPGFAEAAGRSVARYELVHRRRGLLAALERPDIDEATRESLWAEIDAAKAALEAIVDPPEPAEGPPDASEEASDAIVAGVRSIFRTLAGAVRRA